MSSRSVFCNFSNTLRKAIVLYKRVKIKTRSEQSNSTNPLLQVPIIQRIHFLYSKRNKKMGGKRKDMTTTFYEFFFKLSCAHVHKDGTDNI